MGGNRRWAVGDVPDTGVLVNAADIDCHQSTETVAGRDAGWTGLPRSVRPRARASAVWLFVVGFLPSLVFYFINAHERFGGWSDKAIWLWYQIDAPTLALDPRTGPFSLRYLPLNLYTALFMAPAFSPRFPWILPTIAGQSLLTTSPALLLALRGKDWRMWLAVGLSMSACLLVYANGVTQIGARYWILALPFLLSLMAEQPLDRMGKILIGASIVLMSYQIWFIRGSGY